MKVIFLIDCGVYSKDDVIGMETRRANQYISGGHAKEFAAPKKIKVAEKKPTLKPKAKRKPKAKKKADPIIGDPVLKDAE